MYQQEAINIVLNKYKISKEKIDLLIGSDLQNQILASSFAASKINSSFLGVYSACASFVEELIIASTFVNSNMCKNVLITTSSHNLASERQFRFPIEYGALRKKVNTFTATGATSSIISKKESNIKVESATIGSVIDIGYKDSNNMGAVMVPSAAEVIYEHLTALDRKPNYYDIILTGDLGVYGVEILKEYLLKKYKLKLNNIKDAGTILYNAKEDGEIAGGSGPVCLPLVFFSNILKTKKYRKILLVATGSLHSSTSTKLGLSIPSISHAVSLEVLK